MIGESYKPSFLTSRFDSHSIANMVSKRKSGADTSINIPLNKTDYTQTKSNIPPSESTSEALFNKHIMPRLNSMIIDDEYRSWAEDQFKNVTPDSLEFSMAVLDNMEKYVSLDKGSAANAQPVHLGDHESYRSWTAGWQEQLTNWLNSNDPSITSEIREQTQLALTMMEQMSATNSQQTLSTKEYIAGGHAHKNDGTATGPESAFNESFFKSTGVEIGEDLSAFFAKIFGQDNGASEFYKGIFDSRFTVGVTEDGGFVSGVQNTKTERGMPYSYQLNEDTGELEGPYYMFGYPPYQAALMETVGNSNGATTTVEVDHNNIPLGYSNGRSYYDMKEIDYNHARIALDSSGEISVYSHLVRRNSNNQGQTSPFKVFDEVKYYDPSRDMDDYSFATNREHREQVESILADMLKNAESNNNSQDTIESFIEQMGSYFEEAFPLDSTSHDIFAYNRGRNYNPTQKFYDHLQYNQGY